MLNLAQLANMFKGKLSHPAKGECISKDDIKITLLKGEIISKSDIKFSFRLLKCKHSSIKKGNYI